MEKAAAAARTAASRAWRVPWMHRLQGWHYELGIICLSGMRLYAAVANSGHPEGAADAMLLLAVHVLALLLDFHPSFTVGCPFKLRRCSSQGIAQGVLAVPSVLAALTAAASPAGNWRLWLRGSCSAVVAIAATILLLSMVAVDRDGGDDGTEERQRQRQCAHAASRAQWRSAGRGGSSDGREGFLVYALSAAGCIIGVLAPLVAYNQRQPAPLSGSLQAAGLRVPLPLPLLWAITAAAGFCGSLHLLPGCFSLGEAAVLAQGATCLLAAAVAALPQAVAFVPPLVCRQLPPRALGALAALDACTPAAHARALSTHMLPAVVVLILAAAASACLLLRLLWLSCHRLQAAAQGNRAATAQLQQRSTHAAADVTAAGSTRGRMLGSRVRAEPAATAAGNGHVKPSAACPRSSSSSSERAWRLQLAAAVAAAAASPALAAAICVLLLWLACAAAWTLTEFLVALPARAGVLLYWCGLLATTLPALRLWLASSSVPQILVRKVYHVLAMALFVPVFFWDLQLLALSLAIAFAALALLEVTRCLRLPLLGAAVQQFMQKFVDERDAGAIYITHFTLLLGLAVPMWLCLSMPGTDALLQAQAALHQQQHSAGSAWQALHNLGGLLVTTSSGGPAAAAGRSVGSAWARAEAALQLVLLGLSGIVIIGIGDTAASLFGKLYGRLPVHAGSRKTVEGTVAGILLSLGGWVGTLWTVGLLPALASAAGAAWWAQLVAATVGAGLLEAATSQLDNILLPLWYAPHVLLLPAAH